MTTKCKDCGRRHRSCTERCLTCKTARRRSFKAAAERGWVVDVAGGGWWVWDARGFVLGMGNTGYEALKQAEAGL